MSKYEQIIWCVGCDTEISWTPIIQEDAYYCCQDCADNLPCECGYQMEPDNSYDSQTTQKIVFSFAD